MIITNYYRYRKCNFEIAEVDLGKYKYVDRYIDRKWISYKRFHKVTVIKLLSMNWLHWYDRSLFIGYLKRTSRYTPEIELYFKLI